MSAQDFYQLRVSNLDRSVLGSTIVTLDVPSELKDKFKYKQGQYITFKKTLNGEELRRSYSLCSSPFDDTWKVGIKYVEDGRFSGFANDTLQVGDLLETSLPNGNFFTEVDNTKARNFVAFAAGSGITPILSIIKTHLEQEPRAHFTLFYTNQRAATIMLKEALEALKNQFMNRFEIVYFLTKEKRNIPFLNGRVDREKLDTIFEHKVDINQIDHYFICGPEPMIHLVKDYLAEHKVEKEKIHFELFNTSVDQSAKKQALKKQYKGERCHITIIEGGKSLSFDADKGGENILDVALNNNADLPFACKGGVCATCKAKLVSGNVDLLLDYGLEDDEKEAGFILTCQAIPLTDEVTVDYDI